MRFERLILAMGVVMATSMSSAAMALDPGEAIAFCSRISKKDARMECYDQVAADQAAGRMQAAPAQQGFGPAQPQPQMGVATPTPQGWTPPIGGAPAAPRSQALNPPAGFGAASLPRDDARRHEEQGGADSIQAQVAASTDNGLGMWRMRLADGAIWQMTERVSLFRPPAPNETVTIRKGALGGYLMDVGKQGSVRVTRVR